MLRKPFCATLMMLAAVSFSSCSMVKSKEVAERAVAQFRAQCGAGQFHEIYMQADPGLRSVTTEAEMTRLMTALQQRLGQVKTANETGVRVNSTLSGTYVEVAYETEFEHGKGNEQFTYLVSGDKASLMRYDLNSPALMADPLAVQPAVSDARPMNRETLPLSKALLGHWVSSDGKTHMYLAEGRFIIVADLQTADGTYAIESLDERQNKLKLKVDSDYFRYLTFSPDRRTIADQVDILAGAGAQSFNWVFVDNKTQP
ncbi:MAG TPA: hypothetical protein VKA60_21830 [Blastocatellia bacterium]|nr:hypothetical protein [Blastocatellia bacterium]